MTDRAPKEPAAGFASRRRGWRRDVMVCLAAAGVTTLGITVVLAGRALVGASGPVVADGPIRSQHFHAVVSDLPGGLQLATEATFADSVTLTDPVLRVGEVQAQGWLWVLDGRDHEGEDLERVRLPLGTAVDINGFIRPRCDGNDAETIFSVESENSAGKTWTTHFAARNSGEIASAIRQYCDQGPTVHAGMTRMSPDGDAVITVSVVNPGPDDIPVEVPAYSDEHVTWTALTGTVPGGDEVRFEIHGTHVGCEPGEIASWQDGRLLVDGEPFVVTSDDAWC